jgi:hypothetical protein
MDSLSIGSALGNLVTSIALAVAGLAALWIARTRDERHAHALPPLAALVGGGALIALAADEGFELHDRVGRWLYYERSVEAPGPVAHVDDLFVLGYVAAGLVIGMASLPRLVKAPRFFANLCGACGLFAVAAGYDALGSPGTWTDAAEEALEVFGAVWLAAALAVEARWQPRELFSSNRRAIDQPRIAT